MNFRSIMRFFHVEQTGSAMTEFVMGLPIYILIFSGMGALYQLTEKKLEAYGATSASLWLVAEPGNGRMVPLLAATNVNSGFDALQNGISIFGIYADSGIKGAPGRLSGAVSKSCFTASCALGDPTGDLFSPVLLEDNFTEGVRGLGDAQGGWAGFLETGLNVSGTRPALVAGIRYGSTEGSRSVTRSGTVWGQNYHYDPGKLELPGLSQPTHRWFSVAATRLQFATEKVYDKQIPAFNNDFDTGMTNADSTDTSDQEQAGSECTNAGEEFRDCANEAVDVEEECSGKQSAMESACDSLGGSDPFGSLTWGNAGID